MGADTINARIWNYAVWKIRSRRNERYYQRIAAGGYALQQLEQGFEAGTSECKEKSDSGSSVASSDAALGFLQFVCRYEYDSSEGERREDVLTCSSLGSGDCDESVGSTSSVAE